MQIPGAARELAEEPKSLPGVGFHAPVVAADALAAPPAGLDPFGTPLLGDVIGPALQPERNRRAIRRDRKHLQRLRRGMENKRAKECGMRSAECGVKNVPRSAFRVPRSSDPRPPTPDYRPVFH